MSVAVHNLQDAGYLLMDGHDITLTKKGREVAERVMERHELFYNFLTGLGVDAVTAEEDACNLEHALSGESFEAIKGFVEKNLMK